MISVRQLRRRFVVPEGASECIGLSKNTTLPPEHQASQSEPISEGADLATPAVPDADGPRASTKRAVLIGMLERPEGASVAKIGSSSAGCRTPCAPPSPGCGTPVAR